MPHTLASVDQNPVCRPMTLPEAGGTGEGNDEFGLVKYFYSYLQVIFNMP
jgi:hypothetical protein